MDNIAIRVEGISKEYRIGGERKSYKTLRESLVDMAAKPLQAFRSLGRNTADRNPDRSRFWALKDASFEVKQGEVVGIIGRNGAGKSTLLKILSRITEPSNGFAEIHGRVGSLLEVGTGFHPELTGRENVYLNGAILGMKRVEIENQFDQIVGFAEVEKFIDTPVKHYSSGMYLRLAFSVAAHLEPEILLVDEVLAVGDIGFQKKCLGKMEDVAAQGRTVLFVSHNLGAIKEMCQSCVVLEEGRLAFHGPALQGLMYYSQRLKADSSRRSTATGCQWNHIRIDGQTVGVAEPISNDLAVRVDVDLELAENFEKARLYCLIQDSNGNGIVHNYMDYQKAGVGRVDAGRYEVRVEIPPLWLMPDAYTLYFKFIGRTVTGRDGRFESERVILDVTDATARSRGKVRAVIIPPIEWSLKEASIGEGETAVDL